MKKNTSLIKKIETFHKLAVFGNRSDFLKSIAQMSEEDMLTPKVMEMINSTLKNVSALSGKAPNLKQSEGPLADALQSAPGTLDFNALKNAAWNVVREFQKLFAPNAEQSPQYQQALTLAKTLSDKVQDSSTVDTSKLPMPKYESPKPTAKPFPKTIQEALMDVGIPGGFIAPDVAPTGVFDTATSKALSAYKKHFNLPQNMSMAELFNHIRKTDAENRFKSTESTTTNPV